jgi:SAM-dependent methyltransferase
LGTSDFIGFPPAVSVGRTEQQKYQEVWNNKEYRYCAPGEESFLKFLEKASPKEGDSVIDFGCGTGRGAQGLKNAGLKVTGVDFAGNCLDPQVDIEFVQADLTKHIPVNSTYGYCTDVMEHLPPEDVSAVLNNILNSATLVFFQISCVEDHMGYLVGAPLHLTIQDHDWWKQKLLDCGAKILWSEDLVDTCQFYVQSPKWKAADEIKHKSTLHGGDEQIKENIRVNCQGGWNLVQPYLKQDGEVMLIGGGPSLNDFEDDIRQKREAGVPLITTNGAYHWALGNGIKPSAQVMVDARPFNKRFLDPVIEDCKYLVASQCDPSAIEHLPKDRTYLWHSCSDEKMLEFIRGVQEAPVWPTPGGSTVMLRALMLLQALGFYKIHVYGMDSCIRESHHAYPQEENSKDQEITVKVQTRTKEFECAPWMAIQAKEFRQMAGLMDDEVELAVYGDGLIATMIRESAE